MRFIALVNQKRSGNPQLPSGRLDDAELYLEFSYLRDRWDSLRPNNEAKLDMIFSLLATVPELDGFHRADFPERIPDFNAFFMGPKGARILEDIAYPGQWSVAQLEKSFPEDPETFLEFCKFKWSFNIKPDLVVLTPDSPPLCIEAKLESPEGWYPSGLTEAAIFDHVFGRGKGRVGQIELQQFMFTNLLQAPCVQIVVGRTPPMGDPPYLFISWKEVFSALDFATSHPYVEKLLLGNRHLTSDRP